MKSYIETHFDENKGTDPKPPSSLGRRPVGQVAGLIFSVIFYTIIHVSETQAAQLKSAQSNTTILANGNSSVTASISSVDTGKAFLVFGVSVTDASPAGALITGQMTSSTTLTFRRVGTSGNVTIKWHVAEFVSGVTVQRGSTSTTTPTINVPLTSVDLTKSFPIISLRAGGTVASNQDFSRAKLTSSTNLQLSLDAVRSDGVVEWQVVKYDDSQVQTGDVSFANGDSSKPFPISSVNTGKSWLIYSYQTEIGTQSNIGQKLVRGVMNNSTTLTFDRDQTGQTMDLTWYLVEFTDGTTTQHNSQSFTSSETQKGVSISAVERTRSIAVGGYSMLGGKSPYNSDDNTGVAWFTFDLTSATNLQIIRGLTGSATADVGWFVVTFSNAITCTVSTASDSGAGSLRECINYANSNPGTTIGFNIPGPGNQSAGADSWWRISPGSALPTITANGTIIDGTTQTTNQGDTNSLGPEMEINGSGTPANTDGLSITGGGSTVGDLVVNGFTRHGIVAQTVGSNTIAGNYIGSNATGTADLGNGGDGIVLAINNNTIGGLTVADRNVISGNDAAGIRFITAPTTNNLVIGNYIGTNAAGTAAIGNTTHGIYIASAPGNTIGGTAVGAGNLISGNGGDGISISDPSSSANVILGNFIGTNANGTGPVPNNGAAGIRFWLGADDNMVGGTGTGAGNTIAFNAGDGVYLADANADNNRIIGNAIFSNTGLGIDLDPDGPGTGTGANNDKAAPTITSVTPSGSDFTVVATVTSGDIVEFFRANNAAVPAVSPDGSGAGEGYLYLGRCVDNGANCSGPHIDTAVPDANAAAGTVEVTLKASGLSGGDTMSATASDNTNGTSEFGVNVVVASPPGSGVCVVDSTGTYIEAENFTGTIVQGTATFTVESSTAGYNGSGYLRSNGGGTDASPVHEGKQYQMVFDTAGVYNVWIRGYALDGGSDSLFIGLNGSSVGALNEGGQYNQWVWTNSIQLGSNQITVPSSTLR